MSESRGLSRRRFAQGLAATAGATIVPRHVLGGQGLRAPSDTLTIAGVGVGGRGADDLEECEHERIVALCDVDSRRARESFRRYPDARRYKDFRVLLDQERDVDAVVVATPDHTHAVVVMEALRRGKHVYCEKPLTRTIHEARVLGRATAAAGVATQMGNQGHAGEGTRQIREWIEAGLIGPVREVHYWTNRPIWSQALERPTEAHHVPAWLDWDLFLGPARERPYHPTYHPFSWRGWWDFGTGALGDIACHAMDAAFWTFDLRDPQRLVAETTTPFDESPPAASRIEYHFPARVDRQELLVVWRDGNLRPPRPRWLAQGEELPEPSGQLFLGESGALVAGIYGQEPRLYPRELHLEVMADPPPEKYPRTKGAHQEWIDACKGEGTTGSDFAGHAGPLTEMVLLGNLAVRTRRPLEWDPAKGRVANDDEANRLLHDEYRDGWSLEG